MKNLSFFFLQILHLSDQDNVAIFYKIWQQKITPLSKLTGSFLMGTDKHNTHNARFNKQDHVAHCLWLVAGWWFSPGTTVSSTNKTDCHDITEILLKVVLNTITLTHRHELMYYNLCKQWGVLICLKLIGHLMLY
jgi:hypothetical protein